MIVRPRPTAFGLLFTLRGSIVPVITPRVLVIFLISGTVEWVHHTHPHWLPMLTPVPFTLLGLALSIFLGFRNSACYERWWEGRKQWGALLGETRSLVRQTAALLADDRALVQRTARRAVGFAYALRAQLRGTDGADAAAWLPAEEWAAVQARQGRADAILQAQSAEFVAAVRRGALSDMLYAGLAEAVTAMSSIQTACERLNSTPTPFTYTLLLHRTAWLFCLLLPFGLVSTLGVATPVLAAILAYAFFGLDALGDELEEPFGLSPNGLPLDSLVRAIEIAALEGSGATEVPPPLAPLKFLLT
jgi:putative membrane protein